MRTCAAPNCSETFEPRTHNQKYHDIECKKFVKNRRRRSSPSEVVMAGPVDLKPVSDSYDREDHVSFLRRENKRLDNLYRKHKYNAEEQIQTIYNAAYDAFANLEIARINPPKLKKSTGAPEVANPALSDLQIGKHTPSYDSDICRERIEIYGDKVVELTDIQRSDHPVKRAHVYILGDIVEGETIFPGQYFEIDSSLYSQIINGVEVVSDFLRRMLSSFEEVHVAAVIGNHGRLSKRGDYNPESNMDRLLYKFVSMLFANEPRITFDIPEGPGQSNFYTVDYIGNYGTLLMHGDQLSQPTSMHSYYKKVLGWKDTGIPEHFDDVMIGHWHQNTKATFGTTVLRIAGTPESDNLYAQERIGVMGRPSQHLQFVHPNRGVTAEYDVYLD